MTFTYTEKLALKDGYVVAVLNGTAGDGRNIFAYVITDQERLEVFAKDCQRDCSIQLSSYGSVLHSGYGEPTDMDEQTMQFALLQRAETLLEAPEENNS